MSQNNLSDMSNILFAQLETLGDNDAIQDEAALQKEIKRTESMVRVAKGIMDIASLQIQAIKVAESCGVMQADLPALIAIKDSKRKILAEAKE